MYININGKFFDTNREKAKKTNIEQIGEADQKTEDTLQWDDLSSSIEDMEITENNINVSLSNELGWFSIDIPLDTNDFVKLIELAVKKFNKMKATFEGLK